MSFNNKIYKVNQLKSLKDLRLESWTKQQNLNDYLSKVESVDDTSETITQIKIKKNKLSKLKDIQKKLDKAKEMKEIKELKINEVKKEIATARSEYKGILKKKGICPTCGSEVKNENIRKVI